MKKIKFASQKGLTQLVILGIMGLLAIALPIATKLVQQNQENRSKAAVLNKCSIVTDRGNRKCSSGQSCMCTVSTNADESVKEAKWNCIVCASGKTCNSSTGMCEIVKPKVDGVCNNSVKNGCTKGKANDAIVSDTATQYKWRCDGIDGGSPSTTCSKNKPAVNGVCNNSVRNGCTKGNANDRVVDDTETQYKWRCDGINGGNPSITCALTKFCIVAGKTISVGGYACDGNTQVECMRSGQGYKPCGSLGCNSTTGKCNLTSTIVKVTGIEVSASSVTLTQGNKKQITATIKPSNATNKGVNWSVSGVLVAEVSSSGLITAKSPGTAKVYAKSKEDSSIMKTITVTVKSAAPPSGDKVDGKCSAERYKCVTGEVDRSVPSEPGYDVWGCKGKNGGSDDHCAVVGTEDNNLVKGECSTTLVDVCKKGVYSSFADTATDYKWKCMGSNSKVTTDDVTCSLPKPKASDMGVCSNTLNKCEVGTFAELYDSSTNFRWTCKGKLENLTTDDVTCTLPFNSKCSKSYCGEYGTRELCDLCKGYLGCSWGYNGSTTMWCFKPDKTCNTVNLVGTNIKFGTSACGTNTDNKKISYTCDKDGKLTHKTCSTCIVSTGKCKSGGGGNGDDDTPSTTCCGAANGASYAASPQSGGKLCKKNSEGSSFKTTSTGWTWNCNAVKNVCTAGSCKATKTTSVITAINLSPDPLNLKVGESKQVTVTTTPAGLSGEYIWTGVGATIATVDLKGVVTGIIPGETEIKVTVKGTTVTDTLKVIVTPAEGETTSDASVSFKIAFAGIVPKAECISSYLLIPENNLELDIANVPSINSGKFQNEIKASFKETDETDSKGNQIFKATVDLSLYNDKFGSVNNFNYIRVKGPWHLKRRMCQDGQSGKLPESTVCDIDLKSGDTKVYDFSEYTLLAGDVYVDGVINTADLSYIKTRLDSGAYDTNECGVEGDLNMDKVVNTYDFNLVKDSLTERDDE